MAQKNRTKEIWLIPKRVSLHQTICLIDGIIDRNYNGTSWNPQKQNNLGVNLKKWGATRDGKNVSAQAIRTLTASIPQYLGFLYVNTDTTPNTICITEAGFALWNKHKDDLVKIPNLIEGKDQLITKSDIVLKQMEKLQITNPIINKDCENICVFPFRFLLKVLLQTKYLDMEEIAYFLFKIRAEDEVDLTVKQIDSFRKLPKETRKSLIDSFKTTHVGNITLNKAPSSMYFISLCQLTGIVDKAVACPKNRDGNVPCLRIKDEYLEYVRNLLYSKYVNTETYDFKDNLQLWIDYFGNPNRDYPPIDVSLENKVNCDFLIQVFKDGVLKYDDLIYKNGKLIFPAFINEQYNIKIIDISTGKELESLNICPTFEQREYNIEGNFHVASETNETLEELAAKVLEHCEAKNFAGETLNYLNTLSKITGIDKTKDPSLRGAYLEFFIYRMLEILKAEKVIDEVIWNGKIGKYGLPTQAPGGKTGTPDIVFTVDDVHIVVELTTIRPKSTQFSAEGSSVPDHVRLYKQETNSNVVGVFCAPLIHERNTAAMTSTIAQYGVKLHCITDKELVELLLTKNREKIKNI